MNGRLLLRIVLWKLCVIQPTISSNFVSRNPVRVEGFQTEERSMLLKCQTSASLKRVSQQAGQPGSATAGSSSSSGIGSNQFVSGFGASRQPASGKGKGKGGKCIRNAGSVGGTSSISIGAPQSLVSPSVGVAGKKTFDF